jgi:dephospho-CoA kinase
MKVTTGMFSNSRVIGITGGIGSGKSTASEYLRTRGYMVIDADIIAREIMEPGGKIIGELEAAFAEKLTHENGELNRKKLAAIAFADDEKRRKLDEITHSEIIRRIDEYIDAGRKAGEEFIFVDAALLFEAGLDKKMDEVWLIYSPMSDRIKRVMSRDSASETEVAERMNAQMDDDEKQKLADKVIRNDGTKKEMYRKLDILIGKYE